jgi:hypothetical protein
MPPQSEQTRGPLALAGVAILAALFWACLLIFLFGCASTIRPRPIQDNTASFDGGVQNSGVIGFVTNAGGVFVNVTPRLRDRHNALIPIYGTNFLPAPKIDEGITPGTNGTFLMDLGAFEKFLRMNRQRKQD